MLHSVEILIVDDDPALLETLSAALSSPAWNVVSCSTASEALLQVENQPYSAVLVDALEGYERVVTHFRKRNPEGPIVVLTGGIGAEQERRIQEMGADLILLKPVAFSVLQRHLQDLIAVASQKAMAITVFDLELREVMEIERRLVGATVDGDLAVLDEYLSDEYVFAFGSLKETKEDRMQAVRSGRLRYTKLEPLRVEGKHYADLCIVTGTIEVVGERDGKDISGIYRSLRIFGRKQGKWQALAGQLSAEEGQEAIRLDA